MVTLSDIQAHREAIASIAQKYKARDVRIFGSVLRGIAHSRSDVDLLVSFSPDAGFLDYTGMLEELTSLFGCPVDLVPEARLKPEYRDEILSEARPV